MSNDDLLKAGIPVGFDPDYYLEVNKDVAAAGMDAWEHYRNYGCNEGRIYRRPIPHWTEFNNNEGRRGYIYTLPKAGTYLIDEFLKRIGSHSTGWHIEYERYLDTLSHDSIVNRETPSKTTKNRLYLDSFRAIPYGWHAFGHLSPIHVPDLILRRGFSIVCAYRALKDVLVSQFVDFRYRRLDVDMVSLSSCPDVNIAFERYLKVSGPALYGIALQFLIYRELWSHDLYRSAFRSSAPLFFRFGDFLNEKEGPLVAARIAAHYGCEAAQLDIFRAWRLSLDAENKTKSVNEMIDVDRAALWTDSALSVYRDIGFEKIEAQFL